MSPPLAAAAAFPLLASDYFPFSSAALGFVHDLRTISFGETYNTPFRREQYSATLAILVCLTSFIGQGHGIFGMAVQAYMLFKPVSSSCPKHRLVAPWPAWIILGSSNSFQGYYCTEVSHRHAHS